MISREVETKTVISREVETKTVIFREVETKTVIFRESIQIHYSYHNQFLALSAH